METGKIYCIRNNVDDSVYVGSTTAPLNKRLQRHKWEMKRTPNIKLYQKMMEVGFDNCFIELIEEFEFETKKQLREREGEHIRRIGTLNIQIAGQTQAERARKWKANNYEHYIETRREHRKTHKDTINVKEREYHRANKEVHNAASKKWKEENREHCNQYRMDYYHSHHEEQLEKRRQYREKHRDELNAKKREWNVKNREANNQKAREAYHRKKLAINTTSEDD